MAARKKSPLERVLAAQAELKAAALSLGSRTIEWAVVTQALVDVERARVLLDANASDRYKAIVTPRVEAEERKAWGVDGRGGQELGAAQRELIRKLCAQVARGPRSVASGHFSSSGAAKWVAETYAQAVPEQAHRATKAAPLVESLIVALTNKGGRNRAFVRTPEAEGALYAALGLAIDPKNAKRTKQRKKAAVESRKKAAKKPAGSARKPSKATRRKPSRS